MEEKSLKVKVTSGDFSIELEGVAEKVIEQFNDLKQNGLGKLIENTHPNTRTIASHQASGGHTNNPHETTRNVLKKEATTIGNGSYMSLRDLGLKQLPNSESEWILIYAFYASNYGQKDFTREDILTKYEETNRKTDSRIGNITNNIKGLVSKDWFRSLNDRDMVLLEGGITAANEILARTSGSKSKKVVVKKNKNSNGE
jgi:hypothetical protein